MVNAVRNVATYSQYKTNNAMLNLVGENYTLDPILINKNVGAHACSLDNKLTITIT